MHKDERKIIGPNGELRPADPIAHQTRVMEVLTGQREEEYVDEEHRVKAQEKRSKEKRHLWSIDTETGEVEHKGTFTRKELKESQ